MNSFLSRCAAALLSAVIAAAAPIEAAAQAAAREAPGARPGGASFVFERPDVLLPASRTAAPLSLTASDGTGLSLAKLTARAVVEGPVAFTELRLAFENPQNRVIEGQFRVTLPPGASVSRFAMLADNRWQEGEVVDRRKARAAYEDFLHRRQDPALLETAAGNEFSARVFPIPANGTKELILSYSEMLARSNAPYTLPLKGLPEVGELDVSAASGGQELGAMKRSHFVPPSDFEAKLPASGPKGLRSGDIVLARVRPSSSRRPDEVLSLLILFDTSASRALGMDSQIRLLEALIQGLAKGAGPDAPVAVACFDQMVESVYAGGAGAFGAEALGRIRKRRALGASNLEKALGWAADSLKSRPAKRVLLITDGVATAGATVPDELRVAALKLKAAGAERLDAVVAGGIRDEALLKSLTTAGLPRDGVVADSKESLDRIGRRLTEATISGLRVLVDGATWVWPKTLDGIQAGDEVLVYAQLPEGREFKLSIGGKDIPVPAQAIASAKRPLVERAWAQAKIAALIEKHGSADGAEGRAKIAAEVVDISVKHRVLSPFTALLVLETRQDYARWGIDRNALSDILSVDGKEIQIIHRPPETLAAVPDRPQPSFTKRRARMDASERGGVSAVRGAAGRFSGAGAGGAASEALAQADSAEELSDKFAGASEMRMEEKSMADAGPGGGAPSQAMANLSEAMPAAAPQAAPAGDSEMHPMEMASFSRLFGGQARQRAAAPPAPGRRRPQGVVSPTPSSDESANRAAPYTGKFKEAMDLVASGKAERAAALARGWLGEYPGDVMALTALGEALEAQKDFVGAARAYGSVIDLFSSRADLRRFAGERLERMKGSLKLAVDAFQKAAENRPDHPASHRLLAFALLRQGLYEKAFEALAKGIKEKYPPDRFRGVDRILREDLGLIAAAWIKAEPARRADILARLSKEGGTEEAGPSLRFVLNWETDANDVDFHIRDGKGGHAFYSSPQLPSGGELYADVTTGYGPECFTIRLPKERRAYPYKLQAHYYSRGPMGYGMGKLEIIEHDGQGGLSFEERPFVVMTDQAYVDLGKVAQ